MPSLPCLKELDISSTPIIDVSNLGHLTKLSLQNCFNLMDVSFLGKVHTLDLSFTDITDISALGNVHTLNISHCKYIEDFSALGGNHTLDLSFTYIEDVSNLGNVNTLILNCCYRTINISYLRNVKKLKCNNTRFLINK